MEITLHIVNRQIPGSKRDVTLPLTEAGVLIGRRPNNDLCLDDPELVVSGNHARLDRRADSLWVTDISRNGTYLNDASEPLPPQQSVAIQNGDRLIIGPYEIRVQFAITAAPVPPVLGSGGDPFATATLSPPSAQQDLTDLLPSSTATDILDLLGPTPDNATAWAEPSTAPRPLFDDPFTLAAPRAIPQPGGIRDAVPLAAAAGHTPIENLFCQPAEPVVPENYDLLNDSWNTPPPAATPIPPTTAVTAAVAVAPPFEPASSPLTSAPRQSEPSAVTASQLNAFLTGLGCPDAAQRPPPDAVLHQAGELLRVLAFGLAQIMLGRTRFKSELRLDVTTIRAAENNPFKFSVDADDLLERLLFRPTPGFLPAVTAARDAFDDIQAHEMAMTAGLQAALRALLARFEPATLERHLSQRSGLNQVLPMARKAKYWDLFTETYEQVAADASEDFMQLFGDAFARAYAEQIRQLRAARDAQSS